jgi:hypothetical protein
VYEYLLASGQPQSTIKKFFKLWGKNIEWVYPSSRYVDEGRSTGDPNTNTILRVHMACTYAGETYGEVKF